MALSMIQSPMIWLLGNCYELVGAYIPAITLFTLLTKIILFPVSLWTHRNSLAMVHLMPELNRLKIKFYGDKDAIAEETQLLYKREGYHPLLGTVPMFIHLGLLIGVIGAVRELLAGQESALSCYPSLAGGIMLFMPVAAGLSALTLGLAQNRLNPLQREQSKAGQWMTNGLSIGISLALGAFVPVGVGFYWIASNLLTIVQQLILNAVMKPEKYVDYRELEKSRQELAEMDSLSTHVSKEDKQREKADYKRFFSIANKHLVFYSEKSGYYRNYRALIEALLERSNLVIHYVTSDPKDMIFEVAAAQPRIKPYYIGETRLITLMMKMDADMVVMTMPDLETYHIRRSYVRKDIEYIYLFHAMVSTHMIYRKGAFDHYDTIFCAGPHHMREIRETERLCGLPEKRLVEMGYPLLDDLLEQYGSREKQEGKPRILIAPSHHEGNIMDSCLEAILEQLLKRDWKIIVRPHPQYVRRNPVRTEELKRRYGARENLIFETDFSTNESQYTSNILITDWSGISMEYAFVTHNPCIFIDTPMKVLNPDYMRYESVPALLEIRDKIGVCFQPDDVAGIAGAVENMLSGALLPASEVAAITEQYVYHVGKSGQVGARYIIEALKGRREKKGE